MTGRFFICEGEPDTVWAAWHLDGEVTVLGTPGSSYRPREAELASLRGGAVALLRHGDRAGHEMAHRWVTALDGVADDVVVVEFPDGVDLCSSGEDPRELAASLW